MVIMQQKEFYENLYNPWHQFRPDEIYIIHTTNGRVIYKNNEFYSNDQLFGKAFPDKGITILRRAKNGKDLNQLEFMFHISEAMKLKVIKTTIRLAEIKDFYLELATNGYHPLFKYIVKLADGYYDLSTKIRFEDEYANPILANTPSLFYPLYFYTTGKPEDYFWNAIKHEYEGKVKFHNRWQTIGSYILYEFENKLYYTDHTLPETLEVTPTYMLPKNLEIKGYPS